MLYWSSYDRTSRVEATAYPLLSDVARFRLAYLTRNGAWVDRWPLNDKERDRWPRAVSVDLQVAGPGGAPVMLRRVVTLPSRPEEPKQ